MSETTRKNSAPIKVYCLPGEKAEIEALANAANRSSSAYLLAVGLAYRVPNVLDHRRVEDLVRINGDLGRLGGLLKLWLTDDFRTRAFGESTIRAVLSKIEDTQEQMRDVIRGVVVPRSTR